MIKCAIDVHMCEWGECTPRVTKVVFLLLRFQYPVAGQVHFAKGVSQTQPSW